MRRFIFYGAPVVAWLFQYPKGISLLCMIAGRVIAVLAVMAAGFTCLIF